MQTEQLASIRLTDRRRQVRRRGQAGAARHTGLMAAVRQALKGADRLRPRRPREYKQEGARMTIRKIELFSIPVSDQDHAKRFYVDQLGFDVVHERPMGQGVRWLQVSPPGADTSVTLATWFDQPPGSVDGVVLHTDDLEGDIQVLQQRGVPIDDDVAERPWGRYVTFTDPDGNGLILQAPPQPPAT